MTELLPVQNNNENVNNNDPNQTIIYQSNQSQYEYQHRYQFRDPKNYYYPQQQQQHEESSSFRLSPLTQLSSPLPSLSTSSITEPNNNNNNNLPTILSQVSNKYPLKKKALTYLQSLFFYMYV